MAKRRRKVNYGRLGIVVVCFLLIVILVISLFVKTFQFVTKKDDSTEVKEEDKVSEVVQKEELSEELQARVDAYMAANPDKSEEEAIHDVKCDMDLEPYSQTTIIEDDSDMTILINKFNALPEGYIPSDLVNMESNACVQGEDYSCQDVDQIQLREEPYKAYLEWCEAAKQQDIEIRAIAGYRSYEYQASLWNYNAQTSGEEYADAYYARPGQSEHNSGLSVDITFNGYNYNEIENYEGYDWILEHAHEYGFILRYPEEKVDITRYGYESWHFRYVGVEVATKCYENNWCLEEYYAEK